MVDKKDNIVDFLTAKSRTKSPGGHDSSIKVSGNNNIVAGGDVIINKREITRVEFKAGPEHITAAQAKKLQDIVKELVDKEVASGNLTRPAAFQKWYSILKSHYEVPSYRAIPAHLGDAAIDWLQQQNAIKRSAKSRGNNNWRGEYYRGIWARSKELGMSKGDVYFVASDYLGKKITSLKQLSDANLQRLYGIIFSK